MTIYSSPFVGHLFVRDKFKTVVSSMVRSLILLRPPAPTTKAQPTYVRADRNWKCRPSRERHKTITTSQYLILELLSFTQLMRRWWWWSVTQLIYSLTHMAARRSALDADGGWSIRSGVEQTDHRRSVRCLYYLMRVTIIIIIIMGAGQFGGVCLVGWLFVDGEARSEWNFGHFK